MTEQVGKIPEDALQDLALDAQDSVGTVVQLVDTVHRHKLAAKTNQVALATEVYNLKQKHKSLKKGSQALVKAQKKGKAGPLGGIAREITATLFPSRQSNEVSEESEKASAPPMEKEEERNESPPSYEDPEGEAEANVTYAELDAARTEWTRRTRRAEARDHLAKRTEERVGNRINDSPAAQRVMEEACKRAQEAWREAGQAENEYQRMRLKYEKEERERRQSEGLCGPDISGPSHECGSRASTPSAPSVEIITGYQGGKQQVIIQDRQKQNQGSPSEQPHEAIYPDLRGEDEEGSLTFGGMTIPKQTQQSTPKIKKEEGMATITPAMDMWHAGTQHPLQIRDIRRVVIPLIPGNEIAWAVLTEQAVRRGKKPCSCRH